MKKLFSILVMLCCIFPVASAQHNGTKQPWPGIDVNGAVSGLRDSLVSSKVDTILEYRTGCYTCDPVAIHSEPASLDSTKNKGPHLWVSDHAAQPVYIFWVHKGHYFVKKIDQFGVYSTIERPARYHFPIYDYLAHNKDEIRNGIIMNGTHNKEKPLIDYAIPVTSPEEGTDIAYITLYARKDTTLFVELNRNLSIPVGSSKNNKASANTDATYYNAFVSAGNQWKRIIESELFETEFKHLWRKE